MRIVSQQTSRRRSIGEPVRKPGWQIRLSIADAVRRAVESGEAESQNAFVERAILRELRELRRARVYAEYAQAAADESFVRDMSSITTAFDVSASDGLAGRE